MVVWGKRVYKLYVPTVIKKNQSSFVFKFNIFLSIVKLPRGFQLNSMPLFYIFVHLLLENTQLGVLKPMGHVRALFSHQPNYKPIGSYPLLRVSTPLQGFLSPLNPPPAPYLFIYYSPTSLPLLSTNIDALQSISISLAYPRHQPTTYTHGRKSRCRLATLSPPIVVASAIAFCEEICPIGEGMKGMPFFQHLPQ